MGVAQLSGELPAPPLSIQANDKVIGVEKLPGDMMEILPKQPQVYKTVNNNNLLTSGINDDIIDSLKAFIAGTSIKVEWFNQMASMADDNSNFSTVSFLSDTVNCSYLQIVNMELKLREAMVYAYDTDNNISSLTGVGLTYSGFIPKVGDIFVYAIESNVLGLFKISAPPERLTINTNTSHVIKFSLIKILENGDREQILLRVRKTAYFNKQRFLSENTALLEYQEVVDLDYINKNIEKITNHYGNKFYNPDNNSIFRPDGLYDPYLIEFLHKTAGVYFNKKYLIQLHPYVAETGNWYRSIYSKLLDRDNLSDLLNTASINKITCNGYGGGINALINKDVIVLDPLGEEIYIESNILSIDTNGYTDFDKVVTLFLYYGVISYEVLKSIVDTVRSEDDINQFYKIPILIYILKLVKDSILTGKSIKYIKENIPPYINIDLTDDMVIDNIVTVETNNGKVVGIITDTGATLFLRPIDVVYVDSNAVIDLTFILADNNIVTIPNTWKIVITNSVLN